MPPIPTPVELQLGQSRAIMNSGMEVAISSMGGQPGQISLGLLIQTINQRTYSDLLNMAETLPRKSDLEKKIEIVQFAQRTRQLYVRLLALVKWAASASKVEKCCQIMGFLENQNHLFVDTADKLFRMTKDSLVRARLPHFHIPAAVETLTTGSYDRLPLTIRQRILPAEAVTALERKQTLTKLEQIIRHRLVTAELPRQMKMLLIENGRVRFTVEHEFEATLTLMGDGPGENWRLLGIEILVEDKETGDNKALVHSLQVLYIHQLVQSRLQDHQNPLHEVYAVLHAFCQGLQLEVLFAQTSKLLRDRLDTHIRVEEYLQGRSLSLTYWRELTQRDPTSQLGYRLTILVDPLDASKPLTMQHTPFLGAKESEIVENAIRSDHLSIERLLILTIYLRTKVRLSELKQELDDKLGKAAEKCQLVGSPAVLHVPLLQPNLRSEQLLITVDTHTGVLLAHVPQYENCPLTCDLQQALNTDKRKIDDLLVELRFWLMVRRTEKTLQHLPAIAHERLPLMYYASHPLNHLSKYKVFITFNRHPGYVLIVEFRADESTPCEMENDLYFMTVKPASIEDKPDDHSIQPGIPKSYMRAYDLSKLDSFACVHGPSTKVDVVEASEKARGGKRRLPQKGDPVCKRVKVPAYFLPEVAQCVALCDMKLPLMHLAMKLRERRIYNSGEQVEEGGMGMLLRLVDLPSTEGLTHETVVTLRKHLLSAAVRIQMQYKGSRNFILEYVFCNCPVISSTAREQGQRRAVYLPYDFCSAELVPHTVNALLADWCEISLLYQLVLTFARHYDQSKVGVSSASSGNSADSDMTKCLCQMVRVRSYNYRSLTLSYGPNFDAFVTVRYSAERKTFLLSFGVTGEGVWATNPHTMLNVQLEELVNAEGEMGLVTLALTLHHTYQPLLALSKLSSTLHLLVGDRQRNHPVKNFAVVPQSATRVSLVYRNIYCLNIEFLPNGFVAIRDGAFSTFETTKLIEEFVQVQGLKAFLGKYVDENAITWRRSQSEDDNPPSPIPLDEGSSMVGVSSPSPWPTPKVLSPARGHGPMTPPVSSNPHTPASPHPGGMSQQSSGFGFTSSPATSGFSLASPPSQAPMSHPHPSPGGGILGSNSPSSSHQHSVSSPGGFLAAPSPLGGPHSVGGGPHSVGGGPHSVPIQSPASAMMPGSVSSHTSRVLPNKPYAATVATLLTHDAFHSLCSPAQVDEPADVNLQSVLEQYLGITCIRRHFQQLIRNDLSPIAIDATTFQFKTETLCCQLSMQSCPFYTLTLKLQNSTETTEPLMSEELQILEKFFSIKVPIPPYRHNSVQSFISILKLPVKVLKDCIRIMQLELMPTLQQQQQMKWSVNWCLTSPAVGPHLAPPGMCVVVVSKNKILFFLQLSRINVQLPPDTEPPCLMLPIVYDSVSNKTQMAERREHGSTGSHTFQTINEAMGRVGEQTSEVSLFQCLREILFHLSLNPDGSAVVAPPQQMGGVPTGATPLTLTSPLSMASPHMLSPHTPGSGMAPSAMSMISSAPTTGTTNTLSAGQGIGHYPPGMMQQGMSQHSVGVGSNVMQNLGAMQHGAHMGQQSMPMGMMQQGQQQTMRGTMGSMQTMQSGMQGQMAGMQQSTMTGMQGQGGIGGMNAMGQLQAQQPGMGQMQGQGIGQMQSQQPGMGQMQNQQSGMGQMQQQSGLGQLQTQGMGQMQGQPNMGQMQGQPGMGQMQGQAGMGQMQGQPGMGQVQGQPGMGQMQGQPGMGQMQGQAGMGQMQGQPGMGQVQGQPGMGQMQGQPGMGQMQGQAGMGQMQGQAGMGQMQGQPGMGQMQGQTGMGQMQGQAGMGQMQGQAGMGQMQGQAGMGQMQGQPGMSGMVNVQPRMQGNISAQPGVMPPTFGRGIMRNPLNR